MIWTDVEAWANRMLASARTQLEGDLDAVATAKVRGRIAALKELIALPAKQKVMEAQSKTVVPANSPHD